MAEHGEDGSPLMPGPGEVSDQESPGPAAVETPDGPRAAGGAHLVAAGILLSRIAGLVRARFMAGALGTTLYADAISNALKIPNFLQNLLGEGTLSASFIPVYSRLLRDGRDEEAGKVAGAVFSLLLAIAGVLALVGWFAAPLLVTIGAPKFVGDRRDLTILCLRIIFPMTAALVLSAWALGIQNSHRRFFVSYVAPVLWNVAIIAAVVLYQGHDMRDLTLALAWGALIGGLLQFLVQVPFVLRLQRQLRITWNPRLPAVREVARSAGPAITGRGAVQLSSYLDLWLVNLISVGSPAAMTNAMLFYMLPISLFGMSVAAAELPNLARENTASMDQLRERINSGLRQIYYFVVPSFVAFLVLGDVVVSGLLQNGEFGTGETLQVYAILAAYSLGLVASTGTRLFSSTFFALGDTRTPARTAIKRVVIAAIVGGALMWPFDTLHVTERLALGAVGLGLGSSLAAWIEWWLLRRSLRATVGIVGAGWPALTRMFGASIIAVGVGRLLAQVLPLESPLLRATVVLPVVGLLYLGITLYFRLPQATSLVGRFLRR